MLITILLDTQFAMIGQLEILQREEMAMSLGPAKGKDFATSFGPYLITLMS